MYIHLNQDFNIYLYMVVIFMSKWHFPFIGFDNLPAPSLPSQV